jgi:hypothetical protein
MITGQFNGWSVVTMPSSPGFSTVDWTASSVVGVSTSQYNLTQQYQDWQADLLSATVDMPPMQRKDAQNWIAFMQQLRGGNCVFLMGDTLAAVPLGVATGTPVTTATNVAGATQLSTTGWTPSVTDILLPGDYVQVGYRLYRCLDTVTSDSSGNAAFNVFPRIRETIPISTTVQTHNTQGMFRLAKNETTWSSSYMMTYGLSFPVREAI